MKGQIRLADRVLLQFGTSLGEQRDDKGNMIPVDLVELTGQQEDDVHAAIAASASKIYIAADGRVTFDPPGPPPPPDPAIAAERAALDAVINSANPTPAQLASAIKVVAKRMRGA